MTQVPLCGTFFTQMHQHVRHSRTYRADMPTKQHSQSSIAYARSLLELANERNEAEPINADLQALREAIESDPAFKDFLANPSVSAGDRARVLKSTLEGRASQLLRNFVGVLAANGRLRILADTAAAYDDLLGEQLGKIEVDVIVAQRLTGDQLEQVRQKVSAALNKDAVVHQYVDDSIIGGLILRVQDQLIDASVRHQLDAMRQKLNAAKQK
jgi:F-type H+-transporting ATPase subunit delta